MLRSLGKGKRRLGFRAAGLILLACLLALGLLAPESAAQRPTVRFVFDPADGRVACGEPLTAYVEIGASIKDLRSFSLVLDFDNEFFKPRAVKAGALLAKLPCAHKVTWRNQGEDSDSILVDVELADCSAAGPGAILRIEFVDAGARGMSSLDHRRVILRDSTGGNIPFILSTAMMVNECNHAPIARDDTYELLEGQTLDETSRSLLANDSDPDGDLLKANTIPVRGTRHGRLTLYSLGAFKYVHDDRQRGFDSFVYEISDGYGLKSTAIAQLNIITKNDPPSAADDAYVVAEGGILDEAAPGVLRNDADPDRDSLTVNPTPVSGPAHGSLILHPGGGFEYAHDGGEDRADAFVYEVDDGQGGRKAATVNLSISPKNDDPAAQDDRYELDEGGTLAVMAPGILGNDHDPESAALTLRQAPVSGPRHGKLTLRRDGGLDYSHDGSESGADAFVYVIDDGQGGLDSAMVAMVIAPVNDSPSAKDDRYEVVAGDTLSTPAPGLLSNDSDPEGDPLSLGTTPLRPPSHGKLRLHSDGSFEYVHDGSKGVQDTFVYEVRDNQGGIHQAKVELGVTPRNAAPAALNDRYATAEGGTLRVPAPGILGNDVDPNGDSLTVNPTAVSGPGHGSLILHPGGGFEYAHDGGEDRADAFVYEVDDGHGSRKTATVNLSISPKNDDPAAQDDRYELDEGGTLAVMAPGILGNDRDPEKAPLSLRREPLSGPQHGRLTLRRDGGFNYSHDGSESGADAFVYVIDDGQGGLDSATVAMVIAPVNDNPSAKDDRFEMVAGDTLSVPAPGLLSNDSDPEGDPLSLGTTPLSPPSHGILMLHGDGGFEYVHDGSKGVRDAFVYEVRDNQGGVHQARVDLGVTPGNAAPTALNDRYATAEGGTLRVPAPGILGNDVDPNGDPLLLRGTPLDGPLHGRLELRADGGFDYVHDGSETDTDAFTYEIRDAKGAADTAAVKLAIKLQNEAPVAGDDAYTLNEGVKLVEKAPGVLANDRDAENDALTVRQQPLAPPHHGLLALRPDGSFEYRHDGSEATADSFTYEVRDGKGGTGRGTVKLGIALQNEVPEAEGDAYATAQGGSLRVPAPGILGNDRDPDGESLRLGPAPLSGPSHGRLSLHPDGGFEYLHDGSRTEADAFIYSIVDGAGASDTATVKLTVSLRKEAPPDTAAAKLAIAPKKEAPPDTAAAKPAIAPQKAALPDTATARLTIPLKKAAPPAPDIEPANADPYAEADRYTVAEGGTLVEWTPGVLGNDRDPDGDRMVLKTLPVRAPRHGRLTLYADGAFNYSHDGGETTSDGFAYEVSDSRGGMDTTSVALSITPRADVPVVINPGDQSGREGETVALRFEVRSESGEPFRISAEGLPPGLSLEKGTNAIGGKIACGAAAGSPFSVVLSARGASGNAASTDFIWSVDPMPLGGSMRDFRAVPLHDGSQSGGTSKIKLEWTGAAAEREVEIFRKKLGRYPEYDDVAGAEPTMPESPEEAAAHGWIKIAGAARESVTDDPGSRGYWCYMAYAKNPCGGNSVLPDVGNCTLNYRLGDVLPAGGDNRVESKDVSAFGSAYGAKAGEARFNSECDVAPTADSRLDGRPMPDGSIQFEDLMMFALNYDEAAENVMPPWPAEADRLTLYVPDAQSAGENWEVLVWMEGAGNIQGLSIPLIWNPRALELVDFEPGDYLAHQGGFAPLLSPVPGTLDAALFGKRETGFSGAGLLGVVTLRGRGWGDAALGFGAVLARDARNAPVKLALAVKPGIPERAGVPVKSIIYGNDPDPFSASTRIDFGISDSGPVIIKIYDGNGQLVRDLLREAMQDGHHSATWDGRDHQGNRLGPGDYVVQLQAPDRTATRKIQIR